MNKEKIKRILVLAVCTVLLGRAVYALLEPFFRKPISVGVLSGIGGELLRIAFWLALFLLPAALRRKILLPWSIITMVGAVVSPFLDYAMRQVVWQQGMSMTGEPLLWYAAVQSAMELLSWQSVCLLGWLTRRSTEKAAAITALLNTLAYNAIFFAYLHQTTDVVSAQTIQSAAYSLLLTTLPIVLLLFLHPVLTQPVLQLKKGKKAL